MISRAPLIALGHAALALAACAADPSTPADASTAPPDAGSPRALDAAITDAATTDAAITDAAITDAAITADASPSGSVDLPPTGRDAIEAWLATGEYLAWNCESEAHRARPPGAHDVNRICTNDLLSDAPDGPFPQGAVAVKELYDRIGGAIAGYAVAIKLDDSSDEGNGWYWYERIGTRLYADGRGVRLCTGCHEGAGSSFAPTARDYVFTVVP